MVISLKLRISLRNTCVVYLYDYRIDVFCFTVILHVKTLVRLKKYFTFYVSYINYFMFSAFSSN